MKVAALTLLFCFSFAGCKKESPADPCAESFISQSSNLVSMIAALPDEVVSGLAKEPTTAGALGRNKDGYFHVRFQLDMGFLAAAAVKFRDEAALAKFILTCEYAFNRQKLAGDFQLVIPPSLQSLGEPSPADLSSGVSFFISALGSSLMMLEQSSWFMARPGDQLNKRLNDLRPKFQLALDFLKTQKEILKNYDAKAPNRLLFDAVAFYSLGMYLNNPEALAMGREFISLALAQQDASGFLIEGGGFDSSYNAVSLRLGLTLLGLLPPGDQIYSSLQRAMSCCAQWQASRVRSTGEISTEGNTRVFQGGESFLGEEKQVAWIDAVLSFYFVHTLSGRASYQTLAGQLTAFYR